jgi:hypothetical protein
MSQANSKTTPRPLDRNMLDAALAKATEANREPDKTRRDLLTLEACRMYREARSADTAVILAENARLQEAKRRALKIADERSRENVGLRAENERLRAALAEARR